MRTCGSSHRGPARSRSSSREPPQAIGCDGLQVGVSLTDDAPTWEQAVIMSRRYAYDHGGLFARYLIRTQGIDAYVRYYQQAPGRPDPALVHGELFGILEPEHRRRLDSDAHGRSRRGDQRLEDLSVLAVGAADRWSTAGQRPRPPPLLGVARHRGRVPGARRAHPRVLQCFELGSRPSLRHAVGTSVQTIVASVPSLTDAAIAFVQFPSDGRRRFLTANINAPITSASVGPYIADSCDTTVPYQLPNDFLDGSGQLSIIVDQTTVGAVTKYVQVQVPGIGIANPGLNLDVCGSCAFGQGALYS